MEHFSIPSPFPRLAYGNENGKSCRASLALTRKSSQNKGRRNWVKPLPFLFSLLKTLLNYRTSTLNVSTIVHGHMKSLDIEVNHFHMVCVDTAADVFRIFFCVFMHQQISSLKINFCWPHCLGWPYIIFLPGHVLAVITKSPEVSRFLLCFPIDVFSTYIIFTYLYLFYCFL